MNKNNFMPYFYINKWKPFNKDDFDVFADEDSTFFDLDKLKKYIQI